MDNLERLLMEIRGDTQVIRQRLQDHIDNPIIHTVPPCESHKSLTKQLWAIGVAAVAALLGVVYDLLKP